MNKCIRVTTDVACVYTIDRGILSFWYEQAMSMVLMKFIYTRIITLQYNA